MEDVGIADLELARAVLWASGRKAWHRDQGGELKVASYLVTQLCQAVKCRDACDALVIADLHPQMREKRVELAALTPNELADIIAGENVSLPERVLAAWYLAGTRQFPGAQLRERPGSFRQLLDVYEYLGIPPDVLQVAERGSTRSREAHPVSLPLVWQHATRSTERAIRDEAPQSLGTVGGWPSYAYDMHCRQGQRALSLFLNRGFRNSDRGVYRVADGVPPNLLQDLIGTAVFRVEGAAVDRRLLYPGSDAILAEAETAHVCSSGLPPEEAARFLHQVRERMPLLHHCRQIVAGVAQ
jgi:hypothetical protein